MPHSACYCLNSFACHPISSSQDLLLSVYLSLQCLHVWVLISVAISTGTRIFSHHFLLLLISASSHLTLSHAPYGQGQILSSSHPITLQPLNSFFLINYWLIHTAFPTTFPVLYQNPNYVFQWLQTYN